MSCVILAGETVALDNWCRNPGNRDLIIVSTIGEPLATRRIQNCRQVRFGEVCLFWTLAWDCRSFLLL
ncbi:hypothetical protein I79_013057 [Cricetulus griseus]|uniref:Uncharacterized protein n=1 Tax=Cricetulus griseus TaxID=10029 RepID=G3HQF7_CRIGR|nr:hypothetical protein I79_013057 [Cricetulus griseus]